MTPDARRMAPLAADAAALLKALAHPARLMICCELRGGEMSVGDIETALDIKQPRLSRELAKLRDEGLVKTRRQSKVVFYRLADDRAERIIEALCAIMFGAPAERRAMPARPFGRPAPKGGYGVFARTRPTVSGEHS